MSQPSKLELDPAVVRKARSLARKAGAPVVRLARTHTTVSVERAVLRLAGLADAVRDGCGLEHGVALPVWDALLREGRGRGADDLVVLAQKAAAGSVTFRVPDGRDAVRAERAATAAVAKG